jgi:hypothetical protein
MSAPIPQNLADAFGALIHNYADGDWTAARPDDARVPFEPDNPSYESFCTSILTYGDPLPADLLERLLRLPDGYLKSRSQKEPAVLFGHRPSVAKRNEEKKRQLPQT